MNRIKAALLMDLTSGGENRITKIYLIWFPLEAVLGSCCCGVSDAIIMRTNPCMSECTMPS